MGFALTCACFYPGQLNPDAESSLYQARIGVYIDQHPPLMAWTWGWLDAVLPGTAGMFLFQLLWVWLGLGLAGCLILGRRATGAACVLAVGLAPPLLAQSASIWKDLLLAGPLLCAWALLLLAARSWLAWPLVAAAPLLAFACGVRHNAPPALVPLAIWWAWLARARWFPERRPASALALALALWVGVTAAGLGVNRALTDHRAYIYQHLLLYDLAGMSLIAGERLLPPYQDAFPRTPRTLAELEQVYRVTNSSYLTNIPPLDPPLRPTNDPRHLAELRAAWRYAIRHHPTAYLRHRWDAFRHSMGLHGGPTVGSFRPLRLTDDAAPLKAAAKRPLEALAPTILFRGWPYLLLCLGSLGVALRRPRSSWRDAALALGGSALCYVAPFPLVITATETRYLYWPVIASLVLLLLVAARGRRPEPVARL